MTKTVIEKVASSSSEVAVFKVGGTLGYHENKTLQKFFTECKKRNIHKLVLDFSNLDSLGGGCAKIIRQSASKDNVMLAIAGASNTVLKFLKLEGSGGNLLIASSVEKALESLKNQPIPTARDKSGEEDPKAEPDAVPPASRKDKPAAQSPPKKAEKKKPSSQKERESHVDHGQPDAGDVQKEAPQVIVLGHSADDSPEQERASAPSREPDAATPAGSSKEKPAPAEKPAGLRELKRKLVHYNTLLTISSDFNRMADRSSLLDAFLLTTIAQIGVESAAFFEARDDVFALAASKGIEEGEKGLPEIKKSSMSMSSWEEGSGSYEVEDLTIDEKTKAQLIECGFKYSAPFVIQEDLKGIVFLGKPIKDKLDSDWTDFLRVLMNQAAISYEKTKRLEEESERTLGLIHTLISLIEENTMGKGNTDLVSNYTYTVAIRMQYPTEHLKDLMFGTMLRDIGMIKVSDLIMRSPRELAREEWEIIKRHPADGAEMLRRMKFSAHTIDIVRRHHERFNGEGYSEGIEGSNIPLGARIVSVAESYAAMLRDRPNRPALTEEEAIHTLKENWGMRYDPEVVKNFIEVIEEEIRSGEKIKYSHSELFKI